MLCKKVVFRNEKLLCIMNCMLLLSDILNSIRICVVTALHSIIKLAAWKLFHMTLWNSAIVLV